jgi:hypothetical protein
MPLAVAKPPLAMNAGYIARSSSVNFWAAEYTSMRCLQGNQRCSNAGQL